MDFCYKEWWKTLNRCWDRNNEFSAIYEAVSVPHHEQIIADIGCNGLLYAKYVKEKGFNLGNFKYVGIDKRKYNVDNSICDNLSYRVNRVEDNSLCSHKYNVVICTWLLDIVKKPVYVLEEMKRISTYESDIIIELPSKVGAHLDIIKIVDGFKNISIDDYIDRLSSLHKLVKNVMNVNREIDIDANIDIPNNKILVTILNGYLSSIADKRVGPGLITKAANNMMVDYINNKSKIYIC